MEWVLHPLYSIGRSAYHDCRPPSQTFDQVAKAFLYFQYSYRAVGVSTSVSIAYGGHEFGSAEVVASNGDTSGESILSYLAYKAVLLYKYA